MKNDPPTFGEFAQFIQQLLGSEVAEDTRFDADLGCIEPNGSALLEATEQAYGIVFSEESFALKPNESLFSGEGFADVDLWYLLGFRKQPKYIVRDFRVGELYEAVCGRSGVRKQSEPNGGR